MTVGAPKKSFLGSIAEKRHDDHSYSNSGRKHGCTQADTVLAKELRILHLNPQAVGSETDPGPGLSL